MHVAAHGSAWLGMSLGSRLGDIRWRDPRARSRGAKKRVNDRRREGSPGSVQSRLLQLDAISGDTRRRPVTVELRLTSDESLVRTQLRPPGKQPAGTGWCGRRCTRGCASMPKTGWAGWRTGRRGQSVDEADRMGGGIARA
jgi:hypothetical protein